MTRKVSLSLVLLLVFTLLVISPVSAADTGFTDVPDSYWASVKIKSMIKKKWIYGYTDGTFRPENQVSRAELAAMLINATGESKVSPDKASFSDVRTVEWFYSPVESSKNFFVNDPSLKKGLFRPDEFVTRQEAVAAVASAKKLDQGTDDSLSLMTSITDNSLIAAEYRNSISTALKNGLVKGYDDRTFRPNSFLTRAEAVTLVYNAFFQDLTIEALLETGTLKPIVKSAEGFDTAASSLEQQFGLLDEIEMHFFIKDIFYPGLSKKPVYVFARVDPFMYFTYSDAVFKPNPARTLSFAEEVAAAASRVYPGRTVIAMVGYTNLTFIYTAPEVYGREYATFSQAEDGWRIDRFYAGAMARDGKSNDTWTEPLKN